MILYSHLKKITYEFECIEQQIANGMGMEMAMETHLQATTI